MKIRIEDLGQSKIAYFRNIGEYGEKANKELMESLKKWAQENNVFNDSTILGIAQDNPECTPKVLCRYDVCVLVEEDFVVASPALDGVFDGGKYAVFLVDHTADAVSEFWSTLYTQIEMNRLVVRDAPIIERYTSHMIEKHLCEILVPIQ